MINSKRPFAVACAALLATLAWPTAVGAQPAAAWPSRAVTLVVPFPAGGGPDLLARVLADKLSPRLGQPVVVDNRPGAGGLLGASAVARSGADGHTLLLTPNTLVVSPHVLPKGAGGGLDVQRDLVPVIAPARTPMLLLAHPQLGVTDLRQLVALAGRQRGLPFATAGNGSPMHFAGEMLKQSARLDLLHVPYRGAAPAMTAVLGGEVPLLFTGLGAAMPQIRAGKLVPLAITEHARSPLAPQIPTAAEQGVPGVEVNAWFGLFAPAGTPETVVARLNQEVNAALQLQDVREKLAGAGLEPRGGTSAMLANYVKDDDARYGRLARELSIRAD
ncbi:MAG: tripartite tricarboxylate transporter substrate binding protein [Burkholderiales bacterium]|nr:tripartite tricarboxylate transporter substrate binding protein [Burkholderiales bacterium]